MTSSEWGRVDDDGTVYVRSASGEERAVGQYPEGTPEEALAFYTERFAALETEVVLLDQRVRSGVVGPDEAADQVRAEREKVLGASAVGDLGALAARLDSLGPVLASQRAARRAEKQQKAAEAKQAKQGLVDRAEKVAAGDDWRHGSRRLRDLLEEWKALPRIDRPSDDALWKRFSAARSSFTKRRKQHFAEQDQRRGEAQVVKQRLVVQAESLASSTEWGPTSGRYRDLMREWKAAGPAPKPVDDELWARFRAAQDQFFGARDAANAALDEELAANAVVKDALIVEAEALLPVTDLEAAKRGFRDVAAKWDAAGKVPRDRVKELEGRMRKVEQAIKASEDERWSRSDPEKSARADDMVGKLQAAIERLERDAAAARDAGDQARLARLEADLDSRRAFLDMARRAASDYSR